MEATHERLIRDEVDQTFSTVWFVAILVSLISAVPVYLLRDTHPWFIAVPLVIGVALNVVFECFKQPFRWKGRSLQLESPRIEVFPRDFDNFSGLRELLVVELTKRPVKGKKSIYADQTAELDLGMKISNSLSNLGRLRIFKTEEGSKLVAMDCDRFVELLVTDVADSADKTLETSLLTTLKRFSGAALTSEQLYLISNKVAREVLKSDLRGNLLVHLTRNGEHTVKKVLKQLHESEQTHADRTSEKHRVVGAAETGRFENLD